jgi:hypothetical protein
MAHATPVFAFLKNVCGGNGMGNIAGFTKAFDMKMDGHWRFGSSIVLVARLLRLLSLQVRDHQVKSRKTPSIRRWRLPLPLSEAKLLRSHLAASVAMTTKTALENHLALSLSS